MKRSILSLVLLAALTTSAGARVGETEAELTERFGAGSAVEATLVNNWYQQQTFSKNGFNISVCLVDGVSLAETYMIVGNMTRISKDQIARLLEVNAQGHKWTPSKNTVNQWTRDDGAQASLDRLGHSLSIQTHQFLETAEAYHRAQAPSVEGF